MAEQKLTEQIEATLRDDQAYLKFKTFLETRYMKEFVTFYDYYKQYNAEESAEKRKQLGDRMIVKFLTLDGDCCLPDHVLCLKAIQRKLKKIETNHEDYPKDLFIDAYDKNDI